MTKPSPTLWALEGSGMGVVLQFPGNWKEPGWERHLDLNRYIFMLGFLKGALQAAMSLCPEHRVSFSVLCIADASVLPVYEQKCHRLLEANFPAQTQLSNFKVLDCRLEENHLF